MTVVKWSALFFAVIQVIGYILHLVLLFLPQDLLSNIPLLVILLIIWMSFSLFHDMADLTKVQNKRLVYKLFKTWWRNSIASVYKSSVKWKWEKEIPCLPETVNRMDSRKKVFLNILQNWLESTCARTSFLVKLQAAPPVTASVSQLFGYREPRKNILKINFLLLWAIFQC